jgi:hypothetical protein
LSLLSDMLVSSGYNNQIHQVNLPEFFTVLEMTSLK